MVRFTTPSKDWGTCIKAARPSGKTSARVPPGPLPCSSASSGASSALQTQVEGGNPGNRRMTCHMRWWVSHAFSSTRSIPPARMQVADLPQTEEAADHACKANAISFLAMPHWGKQRRGHCRTCLVWARRPDHEGVASPDRMDSAQAMKLHSHYPSYPSSNVAPRLPPLMGASTGGSSL